MTHFNEVTVYGSSPNKGSTFPNHSSSLVAKGSHDFSIHDQMIVKDELLLHEILAPQRWDAQVKAMPIIRIPKTSI